MTALLASLRQGDTIVIWRLDRLGRSLKDLIYLVERFEAAGVGLRSLQESVDTASIGGRLVFHLFGALAEFERNLIRAERLPLGSSRSAKSVNMLCHFRTIPWLVPTNDQQRQRQAPNDQAHALERTHLRIDERRAAASGEFGPAIRAFEPWEGAVRAFIETRLVPAAVRAMRRSMAEPHAALPLAARVELQQPRAPGRHAFPDVGR